MRNTTDDFIVDNSTANNFTCYMKIHTCLNHRNLIVLSYTFLYGYTFGYIILDNFDIQVGYYIKIYPKQIYGPIDKDYS